MVKNYGLPQWVLQSQALDVRLRVVGVVYGKHKT
jgi:hypothetical protein